MDFHFAAVTMAGMPPKSDTYSAAFVSGLFNEMADTYGIVNLIASFGFTAIWRRICVAKLPARNESQVVDLMTGMGELFSTIQSHLGAPRRLQAVDFSSEMCRNARVAGLRCGLAFEISVPKHALIRLPFLFYLNCFIPWIGKLCLGNPANYRMLAYYTQNFGNAREFHGLLQGEGLEARYFEHFFGCASGVFGSKPLR